MAHQPVTRVRLPVITPMSPLNKVANARIAERIVERITGHMAIDPDGWQTFAAGEIFLALQAASRGQ
jgi:hypothetical protein